MSTGLFNPSEVYIQADFGDENGVIYDSCVSLTQGLWPATLSNNITLANGTMITAPLGGYQVCVTCNASLTSSDWHVAKYIPSEFL
jgi:prostatic aicd phosphatase